MSHWIQSKIITYYNKEQLCIVQFNKDINSLNPWIDYIFLDNKLKLEKTDKDIKILNTSDEFISSKLFLIHKENNNSYNRLMCYNQNLSKPQIFSKKISDLDNNLKYESVNWLSLEQKFNIFAIKLKAEAIALSLYDDTFKGELKCWEIPINLDSNSEILWKYTDQIKSLEINKDFPAIEWTLDFGIFTLFLRPLYQMFEYITDLTANINLSIIGFLLLYYLIVWIVTYNRNAQLIRGIAGSILYLILSQILSISLSLSKTPFLWCSNLIGVDQYYLFSISEFSFLSISSCLYLMWSLYEYIVYRKKTTLIFFILSELKILNPLMNLVILLNAILRNLK